MQEPQLASPHRFSSTQVLSRFALRLVLFSVFALVGVAGFRTMFPTLMILSAFYCTIAAALRAEQMFGRVLTHWDEAAWYGAVASLIAELSKV